ncbi:Glyoxylate reductase [Purpureocillium takamizusanense]|uniref:Glyoxylate reductase n=1 Tax=Purpureocillium takamizusanense TaxID=2060973 RepID=A0A9Q8QCL6_9HYPO|nr:Glyoxylate reductase [Purpureocillium takamizusanense]UNI16342.1 Glyoxylate reductase [Purpureocillium takamizusanense]
MAIVVGAAEYGEIDSRLAEIVHEHYTIDACIVLSGICHFQPFGRETKQLLLHGCRFIVSVSPGCRMVAGQETREPVTADKAEAMVDMALSLALASISKNFFDDSPFPAKAPQRKSFVNPADPVLGIAGMGEVGKYVSRMAASRKIRVKYFDKSRLGIDGEAYYQAWYCRSVEELISESDVVFNSTLLDSTERNVAPKKIVPKDSTLPIKV